MLAIFTGVLAVATIFLARYTGNLNAATSGLQKLAENQEAITKNTQRAYIAVKPNGLYPFDKQRLQGSETNVIGGVIIHNVGLLPAKRVRWKVIVTCDASDEWSPPPIREKLQGDNVVPRGIEMEEGSNQIKPQEVVNLKRAPKQGYCYVWGVVRYLDGFDNRCETNFCHRYNCGAFSESKLTIAKEDARYHKNGNDAT